MDSHLHPQCSLSTLISHLQSVQSKHGDLPVIFWDQNFSVVFDNLDHLTRIKLNHVYIGGFHVNGDNFCNLDPHMKHNNIPSCSHESSLI